MKHNYLIISLILAVLAFSCNTETNQVVVYTSVDQVFSEPILKEILKKKPALK